MSEDTPSRWKVRAISIGGGLLALVGAMAAGFSQTVGSVLGSMVFPAPAPSPQPNVPSNTETRGVPKEGRTATPLAAGPITPAPTTNSKSFVVLDRVRLDFGGQGEGQTRSEACAAAMEQVTLASTRQCDAIAKAQKGSTSQLEDIEQDCRSCGPTGGGWRCIAHAKPNCVISGELD